MTALVELCAGSAALSLHRSGQVPPIPYQGGKRAYADQILAAMGLSGAAPRRCLFVDPGCYGEAWAWWCSDPAAVAVTVAMLDAWRGEDPLTLWTRLAGTQIPSDPAERVAAWSVLQFWGYASKPVCRNGGWWQHHGFDATKPYRRSIALAKRAAGQPRYDIGRDQRLDILIERLMGLDLSGFVALHRRAQSIPPFGGAVVYIDPPYQGVTGYGWKMTRADVVDLALAWWRAGSRVFVSEAEPVDIPGWSYQELRPPRGRGRTFSNQRREVLTISPPTT